MNAQGKVEDASVEHGVEQDGKVGVKIHTNFSVENVQNVPCKIIAYFYKSSTEEIKGINSLYRTTSGQLCVSSDFTPLYASTLYQDFSMFIPYEELKGDCKDISKIMFQICLYINDEAKFFHWSKYFFVQPLTREDLTPQKQELLKKIHDMEREKTESIVSSQKSFIEWIKTEVSWVWNEIYGKIQEIWDWVIGLFSF